MFAFTGGNKRRDHLSKVVTGQIGYLQMWFDAPFLGDVFLQGSVDAL